ncbi:MAG: hypothetical protein ABI287_14850 [Rhodanobacter sp.]
MGDFHLYKELRRRNVLRAAVLYVGAVWALAQGISQLGPSVDAPDWTTRWFLVAAIIGFPFWIAFAWFYEFTPSGLRRESEIDPADSVAHHTSRQLNYWITGVLAVAVIMLLTDRLTSHKAADTVLEKSIAVLPLVNESGDPHQDYFSDGLSEELISSLAQIKGLKVIGRSSSFRFKGDDHDSRQIGEALGVATLLEGTVRRQGKRVRIVAELINAADGRELWSQTYDRELEDIFAVQQGIANAVADSLEVKLLPARADSAGGHHVPSFATYDHFLLGRQMLMHSGIPNHSKLAVDAFRQAVALDPDYAEAYSGLAMAESFVAENNPDATLATLGRQRAMAAAERAVALDPALGDAYGARGYLRGSNNWDWPGAESDLLEAVTLDPGDARNQLRYGFLLATLHRLPEADIALRKCTDHDPLFPPCWYWRGRIDAAQGDYDDARLVMKRTLSIDHAYGAASTYLGVLSLLQGDPSAAREVFIRLDNAGGLAMAEHDLGHTTSSSAALDRLTATHAVDAAYEIATVHAWVGDPDGAFTWLERAIRQRDGGLVFLTYDPLLRRLYPDPRFAVLCHKMRLPAPGEKFVASAPGSLFLPRVSTLTDATTVAPTSAYTTNKVAGSR